MPSPNDEYWRSLETEHFVAGWAKPEPSLYPEPRRDFLPATFRFAAARAALLGLRGIVPDDIAERRNLICVNPATGVTYATTSNLVVAYQMVGAGERARSHRHTPNALRLILEARPGMYTVVDGCRLDMSPGDVVLTPNWCWHGHANESSDDAFWIDFLDVPLVQHLGPMFTEQHPRGFEPVEERNSDTPLQISTSAVLKSADIGTGLCVLPIAEGLIATMSMDLLVIPSDVTSGFIQTSANSLYALISGSCSIRVAGSNDNLCLAPGDVAAIPTWVGHEIIPNSDAVLLQVSDAPGLSPLGLLRTASERD